MNTEGPDLSNGIVAYDRSLSLASKSLMETSNLRPLSPAKMLELAIESGDALTIVRTQATILEHLFTEMI
jgi:hypothetical protein